MRPDGVKSVKNPNDQDKINSNINLRWMSICRCINGDIPKHLIVFR